MANEVQVNVEALKSEIRSAVINQKATATPMTVRLAWHAAGTFDKNDSSGGSNGAGMRFEPESTDGANAGLGIIRDLLYPIKQKHPEVSYADLWTLAGAAAVQFAGGPTVQHNFGRTDFPDGSKCVANGRLPDATQGAEHLRQVFGRMGFNDQEIVALSGAHTLGRCHSVRSGFDGPWTSNPLRFDNEYFKNLIDLEWTPRKWDGPLQYEDPSGKLMMLPTDIALKTDPEFRKTVELYAKDEQKFFDDFATAFAKLLSNGCPETTKESHLSEAKFSDKDKASAGFRENAMHGSVFLMKKFAETADINAVEPNSGRTALHKAAFWGHVDATKYLVNELKININATDYNGDTALHDAARFGHTEVVNILLEASADTYVKNTLKQDASETAAAYAKQNIVDLINSKRSKL